MTVIKEPFREVGEDVMPGVGLMVRVVGLGS